MGFDLTATFLFTLILFVLFYTFDSKTKVIDQRKPPTVENFTGDYEDYALADIHTNPSYDDPLMPDNEDEIITDMSRRTIGDRRKRSWGYAPDQLMAATGRRDASWNTVFSDYSVTESELDALTGVRLTRRNGQYVPSSTRSLEDHDYKSLE